MVKIILCLSVLISIANAGDIDAGDRFPERAVTLSKIVYSVDWLHYRYLEELMLWHNDHPPYSSIKPYITDADWFYSLEPMIPDGRRVPRVSRIIRERILAHEDKGNFLLNDLFGSRLSQRPRYQHFRYSFVPYVQEIMSKDTLAIHRIGLNAESWWIPNSSVLVHLRARLENHGELYSRFNGRVWKEKITGWLDNAAIYYHSRGFFGSFGRSSIVWGPEIRDALLISANSPPFNRLWLGCENHLFRFDYFLTRLDNVRHDGETLVRYMSAHRLSFRKSGWFELGLSEVALYGGVNRPLEWHYLNPFLPYYWEQFNRRTDDNILFGVDLVLYWPRGCRIFSELMVDDFQIDFKSEPHQVGYKIGVDALEPFGLPYLFTKLSYTRVNTTVYGQNQPQNQFLHLGEPIGYFDGNDQDRWLALLRYHLNYNFDFEVELAYTHKGEGRIEQHERPGVPFENKFPIGVVEKSPRITLTIQYFSTHLLEGHIKGSWEHFDNYRNIAGDDRDMLSLDFFLSWHLQGLIW